MCVCVWEKRSQTRSFPPWSNHRCILSSVLWDCCFTEKHHPASLTLHSVKAQRPLQFSMFFTFMWADGQWTSQWACWFWYRELFVLDRADCLKSQKRTLCWIWEDGLEDFVFIYYYNFFLQGLSCTICPIQKDKNIIILIYLNNYKLFS